MCHHFLVWYVWLYLFALAPSNNSSSLILYCSPWSEPQHVHCASHISLITLLHPQCFASISSTSLLIIQSFFILFFCKHFHPETTLTNYQCSLWSRSPQLKSHWHLLVYRIKEVTWYRAGYESCPKSVLPYLFRISRNKQTVCPSNENIRMYFNSQRFSSSKFK